MRPDAQQVRAGQIGVPQSGGSMASRIDAVRRRECAIERRCGKRRRRSLQDEATRRQQRVGAG
jgi:hypothetical protein